MTETIICQSCKKPINSKSELVTAMKLFKVKPFHNICYSKLLKTRKAFVLSNHPINISWSRLFLLLAVFAVIFILYVVALSKEGVLTNPVIITFAVLIFLYLFVWQVIQKIWSYYLYESKLK